MNILIVDRSVIPVSLYGGTERVIWSLGKELVKSGHQVTYMVRPGSACEFAKVVPLDENQPIAGQIPEDIDVIHFNYFPDDLDRIDTPYIVTMHGNVNNDYLFDKNTVFVSKNHAERYNSTSFVHNGLDWNDYSTPDLSLRRDSFHFLGKAVWKVKNLKGAIDIIKKTDREKLNVLGGTRFNERVAKMGPSYLFSSRVHFAGMVGGIEKEKYMNRSKGLIFPVLWHEPFGLALIESMYFGCPVFGTPYGALKEIVTPEVGFLSASKDEISRAITEDYHYTPQVCHDYAVAQFNSKNMALGYIEKYEQVINGDTLNENHPQLKEVQKEKLLPFY